MRRHRALCVLCIKKKLNILIAHNVGIKFTPLINLLCFYGEIDMFTNQKFDFHNLKPINSFTPKRPTRRQRLLKRFRIAIDFLFGWLKA
jgi:hypothetical protein